MMYQQNKPYTCIVLVLHHYIGTENLYICVYILYSLTYMYKFQSTAYQCINIYSMQLQQRKHTNKHFIVFEKNLDD